MPGWLFIILIIQSALQSFFLVFYFRTDHRFRKWTLLMFFFIFILYPVDHYILNNDMLIKNIVNLLALYAVCSLLFRNESWKKRVTGLIFFELILVGGEFIGISTYYFIFSVPPDFTNYGSNTAFIYSYSCIVMLVLDLIALRLFSRGLTSSEKINFFLFSLLVNVILTVIAWCITTNPQYYRIYSFDYSAIFILLALLNLYTAVSLIRFAKKEVRIQAAARIESAYLDQVKVYLQAEEQEENLHRLRHDLINFNQTASSQAALEVKSSEL